MTKPKQLIYKVTLSDDKNYYLITKNNARSYWYRCLGINELWRKIFDLFRRHNDIIIFFIFGDEIFRFARSSNTELLDLTDRYQPLPKAPEPPKIESAITPVELPKSEV